MRKIVLFILCAFLGLKSVAQEPVKHLNFIISIDGRVIAGSMRNMKFVAALTDGSTKEIRLDFGPGDMSLPDSDYVFLKSEKVVSIRLKFMNTIFKSDSRAEKEYDYDINVGRTPLLSWFYVLYIYNLDNPLNKGIFWHKKGETYISEFESSEGTTSRIRLVKKNKR